MTKTAAPPHDERAEQAALGGATIWATNVEGLVTHLTAADFYTPAHQRWFMALADLYARGEPTTTVAVGNEMVKLGEPDPAFMVSVLQDVAERNIGPAMRVVAELALRRRLLSEANALQAAANDVTLDPGDVLDTARAALLDLEHPMDSREPDDEAVESFLERGLAAPTPWVIEGLLRQGWRTVIVAREGQGKTWLLRQIAVCAAYGIHPLRFERSIEPVRTLLVDLENPEDHLHFSLQRLVEQAKRTSEWDRPVQRLWRRPGGINIRRRADRLEMEALLAKRRPQLLVMGPLYKLYRANSRDSWDLVASEIQEILDDWRARFSVTMLIEDHAPKGQELVPFGSSLWLRWPEIGIGLVPHKEMLNVTRWRGDRMPTDWPMQLERGSIWPWVGHWPRVTPEPEPVAPEPDFEEQPF